MKQLNHNFYSCIKRKILKESMNVKKKILKPGKLINNVIKDIYPFIVLMKMLHTCRIRYVETIALNEFIIKPKLLPLSSHFFSL